MCIRDSENTCRSSATNYRPACIRTTSLADVVERASACVFGGTLDGLHNQPLRVTYIHPLADLSPFASLQVFVVGKEVGDLLTQNLGQIEVRAHVDIKRMQVVH